MRPSPSLLVLLCAAPLLADEGRIPIHSGGVAISNPGHYVLTRDISGTISVFSDDVVIDLNGRTITPAGGYGVDIHAAATNVTIRNGTINGGASGVTYSNSTAGYYAHVLLEDLTLVGQSAYGIIVYNNSNTVPDDVTIRRCHTRGTGSTGIYVLAYGGRSTVVIEDCAVRNAGLHGISTTSATVRRCTVSGFGSAGAAVGIQLAGANGVVADCSVSQLSGDDRGITAGDGALVVDNTVRGCGGDGIYVSGYGCRIAGNLSNQNGGDGIDVGGLRNLVEGNQMEYNTGCALRFGDNSHAYRNNMLRANFGGAVCGMAATDAGGNIP